MTVREARPIKGDIAVKGDRIETVEKDLGAASAACAIDASGMVVCPGFIDIHTHSDFSVLVNRKAESALFQGITTDVCGNCGLSMYPVSPDYKEQLLSYTAGLGYKAPFPVSWTDFDGYAEALEKNGLGVNMIPLAGHGSIRIAVMGFEARQATPEEIAGMRRCLETAFEQGAFGLSTGLIYPPGINSPTDELEALCRVVAERRPVLRDASSRRYAVQGPEAG